MQAIVNVFGPTDMTFCYEKSSVAWIFRLFMGGTPSEAAERYKAASPLIPATPFLHANLQHLLSNTVPLFVLLTLLAGSNARSWEIVMEVVLLGGLLLWIFGRNATHVGASGLIFGLIAFLIVSGFREKRIVPLIVSVIVGFLYGGTLLTGVMPRFGSQVSWDGHLFGAIGGGIIAYVLTREPHGTPTGIDEGA